MPANIIITHRGNPKHLKYVLDQAIQTNPNSRVILMGDETNNCYPFVEHVYLKDYFKGAEEFSKIYKHQNGSPYDYELFCYQRWFCVYEFLEKNNLDDVFSLDSDVLIYDNLDELQLFLQDYSFGVCAKNLEIQNPGYWIAGPPLGYFKKDTLKELIEFFKSSYSDPKYLELFAKKMEWHNKRNEPYGICDMTHIFFFVKENRERFFNLAMPFLLNGTKIGIDETILDTIDYVSKNNHKKLLFKNGKVYAFLKDNNEKIQFPLLHFQGYCPINAKEWIPRYYSGKRYYFNRIKDAFLSKSALKQFRHQCRNNIKELFCMERKNEY